MDSDGVRKRILRRADEHDTYSSKKLYDYVHALVQEEVPNDGYSAYSVATVLAQAGNDFDGQHTPGGQLEDIQPGDDYDKLVDKITRVVCVNTSYKFKL